MAARLAFPKRCLMPGMEKWKLVLSRCAGWIPRLVARNEVVLLQKTWKVCRGVITAAYVRQVPFTLRAKLHRETRRGVIRPNIFRALLRLTKNLTVW